MEISERYSKALNPTRVPPRDAPAWIEAIDNPYLQGHFAPVQAETEATTLEVEGELPRELNGAYFRNGPNPRYAPKNRYHWFDGDGMVHGIWFEDGRARYRNRYVQTAAFAHEAQAKTAVWPGVLGPFDFSLPLGPIKDTSNTDLVVLDGQLVALWYESGTALALDPATLATRARIDTLPKRISAHSKVDPNTGDFLWFSYGDRKPYLRYGVLRPDGSQHAVDVELPGPRRPHDLGVTEHYSILHDFPVFYDEALFQKTGKRIPLFHPDVPTRFGVIPRFGDTPRWFEFSPCYMLHVVACWEEGDEVVMIGCRNPDPTLKPRKEDGKIAAMLSGLQIIAHLHEWRMNLKTGATSERELDDRNLEFPMCHPGRIARRRRYSYLQLIPHEIPATFDALVKVDLETGAQTEHRYGPGIFGSEAPFVPRPGATDEDDGWLVTFVTDVADWSSAVWVYDAQHVADGPIAKVRLPVRVPAGFHATWMPTRP